MDATESSAAADGAPRLSVAAVAHRLGVAPATLRTWARRYGLGPSEHAAGTHRRYTATDLARLHAMRRLTLQGVPPAEAAAAALTGSGAATGPVTGAPEHPVRRPGSGGRVLALPSADPVVRGLGRAALALDSRTVIDTTRTELARHGVVATWESVLRPVLAAAGARWASTGEGIEVEHLLADCVVTVLREISEGAPERPAERPVLLACAPDEQHVLPLHAVAAGLAELGVACRVLGSALPAGALHAAVRRTGAAVLFVWSQRPGTADPGVLDALPPTRPPTTVVVGGPGWAPGRLPRSVRLAQDLPHALALVRAALGA